MHSAVTPLLLLLALSGVASAGSVPQKTNLRKRDMIATTPAPNDFQTIPPLAQITENPVIQTSLPLYSTVSPGAAAPYPIAPAIPNFVFTPGTYPALDIVPPTDSSEVVAWLAELDLSAVPDLNATSGACDTSPEAAADKSRCWWTCGGCSRDTDITLCPDKLTWGVSYDDGPSPFTPLLLDVLNQNDILATFFVVGSRVVSYPEVLQLEYASGHQLSIHTWSHPPLTTLTNAQIVAEIGWTRKAIKDVTGVTPNTMRPPYGDIDDRVRAVLKAMGVTPIIWTTATDGTTFDTDDWKINGGTATGESSVAAFNKILEDVPNLDTGFIVLEHDLWQQTVDLSVGYFLPAVINSTTTKIKLTNIINCLHQPAGNAYVELNVNNVPSTQIGSSNVSASIVSRTTASAAPAATSASASKVKSGSSTSTTFTSGVGSSSSTSKKTGGGRRSSVVGILVAGGAFFSVLASL